jgi:hypothetical protein
MGGYHYTRQQFEELWQRYLSAQGVYEPLQRYNTDEIDTLALFKPLHERPM